MGIFLFGLAFSRKLRQFLIDGSSSSLSLSLPPSCICTHLPCCLLHLCASPSAPSWPATCAFHEPVSLPQPMSSCLGIHLQLAPLWQHPSLLVWPRTPVLVYLPRALLLAQLDPLEGRLPIQATCVPTSQTSRLPMAAPCSNTPPSTPGKKKQFHQPGASTAQRSYSEMAIRRRNVLHSGIFVNQCATTTAMKMRLPCLKLMGDGRKKSVNSPAIAKLYIMITKDTLSTAMLILRHICAPPLKKKKLKAQIYEYVPKRQKVIIDSPGPKQPRQSKRKL